MELTNWISAIIIPFRAKIAETTERRPPRTNSPTIAAKDKRLQAKGKQIVTKLGYQPKILLPEGDFFRFEILSADIEDGEYGYQLGLELKTLGGKHSGHIFKDWSKISGDQDDGLFIKEGSKAEELVRAVLGDGADLEDLDTDALEGGRLMARVAISQNGKRNRVDFGSIGRIPDKDAEKGSADIPF
jgi:hypothetical protein